jgi:competence protein ComEA
MYVFRLFLIASALPGAAIAQLPDGTGKEETVRLCSQCHELARSLSLRQDRDGWQATMDKMVTLGLQGKEEEMRAVVDYLAKNFAAEAVPKVNINTASAIELESGLSLKRSESVAVIEYRTKNGKFHSLEDLKKVTGVSFAKFEAKKDRLAF